MGMKKNGPGGCGCCGDTCEDCTSLTYVTISGMNSGGLCPSGCEAKNGTYIFRTAGGSPCGLYTINMGTGVCGSCPDFNPGTTIENYSTGSGCCGIGGQYHIYVQIQNDGSLIKVTVQIAFTYEHDTIACEHGGAITNRCGSYDSVFEKTFTRCADIAGTSLPLTIATGGACIAEMDTGDLCGIHGASASIG